MNQKWYQSIAYDVPFGRLWFIINFKGPRPLKFEKKRYVTTIVAACHITLQLLQHNVAYRYNRCSVMWRTVTTVANFQTSCSGAVITLFCSGRHIY
jgi:hypothetical protein